MYKIVTECHFVNISLKYILSSGSRTNDKSALVRFQTPLITAVNSEKDTLHFEMPSMHLVHHCVVFVETVVHHLWSNLNYPPLPHPSPQSTTFGVAVVRIALEPNTKHSGDVAYGTKRGIECKELLLSRKRISAHEPENASDYVKRTTRNNALLLE